MHRSWVLATALVLLGCGETPWQEFRSPEGDFTVSLPKEPTLRENPGSPEFDATYLVREGAYAYSVSRFMYKSVGNHQSDLDNIVKRSMQGCSAESHHSIKQGSFQGVELTQDCSARRENMTVISHVYLAGTFAYQLTVVTDAERTSKNVTRFLDSFRIIPKVEGFTK